uniref:Uncharacterized protein n=1 Tax=Arundo donax TaxID=35708 RepID=A0A0A9GAW9_ARUDO
MLRVAPPRRASSERRHKPRSPAPAAATASSTPSFASPMRTAPSRRSSLSSSRTCRRKIRRAQELSQGGRETRFSVARL